MESAKIPLECQCGNKDNKFFYQYKGSFGYNTNICMICGCSFDHLGFHEPDEFTKMYVMKTKIKIR
jgi:hypothetical protein